MASNSKPHAGSRTPLPDSSNGEWERQTRACLFGQNEPYSQKKPDSMESSELFEAIIYLCGTETALEKQNRHFRDLKMLTTCKEEFLKRLPKLKEEGESWLSTIDKLNRVDISEAGKAALEKDASDFEYDSEGISSFFSPFICNQIDKDLGKTRFRLQYMNACDSVNQGRELKDWEWGHALQETLVLDPKLEEEFSTGFRNIFPEYVQWEKLNNFPGSGSLISKIQGASSSASQPEFILPLDKSQPIFKKEAVDLSSINTLDIIRTIVYLVRTEIPEEKLAWMIYRMERVFALRKAFYDKNLQKITVAEWDALVARLPAISAIKLRDTRTEGDGADEITSNPQSKSKSRDKNKNTEKRKFLMQLSNKFSRSGGFFRELMTLCEVMNEGKPFDQWSWAPAMEQFNSIETSSNFAKGFKEYFSEKLDFYKKEGKFFSRKYQV